MLVLFPVLTVVIDYVYNNRVAKAGLDSIKKGDKIVFHQEWNKKVRLLWKNATNYTENKETKIKSKPKYLVHFVDPKDSINDVYYYIYIENNNIYVQFDTVKMKKLIDKFDIDFDDSIKRTTVMTVKDLDSVLALK